MGAQIGPRHPWGGAAICETAANFGGVGGSSGLASYKGPQKSPKRQQEEQATETYFMFRKGAGQTTEHIICFGRGCFGGLLGASLGHS
eukprot:7678873-Pyramimonas_sp.AAC.1